MEDIDGVRIWQTPRWSRLGSHDGGYAPVDNLARMLSIPTKSYDVIHAFDHRPNVILPWFIQKQLVNLTGKKSLFVSDWCDWWTAGGITTSRRPFAIIDRWEQKIEEGSKRASDGVTVISSVLYERARRCGIPHDRLLVLPAGVQLEKFPVLDKASCRQQFGLPRDKMILGFIGFSLWDLELLADAFALIHAQYPQTVLLVIGGGVEESAKNIFHHRFRVGENVIMPGVIPFEQVPAYLCACDIQLLPMQDNLANQARIPNKLTDYYASGRAVVVSHVGDTGRYVQDQQTGITAGTDAGSFAQSVVQLIHNRKYCLEAGVRARSLAENEYSYSILTKKLMQFYTSLISNANLQI